MFGYIAEEDVQFKGSRCGNKNIEQSCLYRVCALKRRNYLSEK